MIPIFSIASVPLLRKYLGYFEDSFLIESAQRYDIKGKAYIDFVISISYSKTAVISNKPSGIVAAYSYMYGLNGDEVSLYRIAREHTHVSYSIC